MSELLYGFGPRQRFTQDSPIRPDAWMEFGMNPGEPVELLLEPHIDSTPAELFRALRDSIKDPKKLAAMQLSYNHSVVLGHFTLEDVIRYVLPWSHWWERWWKQMVDGAKDPKIIKTAWETVDGTKLDSSPAAFLFLIGTLLCSGENAEEFEKKIDKLKTTSEKKELIKKFSKSNRNNCYDRYGKAENFIPLHKGDNLFAISTNRPVTMAVRKSSRTVKADAASHLFDICCSDIVWAVVDSGIDATHPAFRNRADDLKAEHKSKKKPIRNGALGSRIIATYDFSRIQKLLSDPDSAAQYVGALGGSKDSGVEKMQRLKDMLREGRALDWNLLRPALEVPHDDKNYVPPQDDHGTHVAGILAANWPKEEMKPQGQKDDGEEAKTIEGVCPDIRLIDIRVFDDKGKSSEFTILCALQFLRHLNTRSDVQSLHGINISLSLHHDVKHFACGRTPICVEVERTVNAGMVVVAAAGNAGFNTFDDHQGNTVQMYNDISITDPGNADAAITVGATHRSEPHTYGVSYFSSRGPTAMAATSPT